jgi:hypothetical protein
VSTAVALPAGACRRNGAVRLPGRPRVLNGARPEVAPAWCQTDHVAVAARVIDRVLRSATPPRTATGVAEAVDDALATVMEQIRQTSRQTRGEEDAKGAPQRAEAVRAHGCASLYLRSWQPGAHLNLSYAGQLVASATKSLPAELDATQAGRYPRGRRLGWASDRRDLSKGLLLDRLHYTYRPDLVLGQWMGEQVEADLELGAHLAGTSFLGVRVLVPLARRASVHVTAVGNTHPLGACSSCATTPITLP